MVADGLFKDQEDIDSWVKQSFGDVKPGDIKYVDINGDGIIDSYDVKPTGYPAHPRKSFTGRFSAAMEGIRLSAFFQGVAHVNFSIMNDQTQPFIARNPKEAGVFADIYNNYWTPDNLDAKYPRLTTGTNPNNSPVVYFLDGQRTLHGA